jgi:hypothetical protein
MEDFERNISMHFIRTLYNFDLLVPSLNTFLFQLPEVVVFYMTTLSCVLATR